jgi:hypothetical protein
MPWDPETPVGWALQKMPSGGTIGRNGLVVLETRDRQQIALQVAYHFIGKTLTRAPLWFQIGFARYLASFRIHYGGDVWISCFGRTVGMPNRLQVLLPIDELAARDWRSYDAHGRYWYEYTAQAVVEFLLNGGGQWQRERFPIFVNALMQGTPTAEALVEAYPHLTLDDLDQRTHEWVYRTRSQRELNAATIPVGLCFRIPPAPDADRVMQVKRVSPDEIRVALDDFERLPIFKKFASWYPNEVVDAEARPARPHPPSDESTAPLEVRTSR